MKHTSHSPDQPTGSFDGGLFELGERLGDNYQVLQFISSGADAEVYKVLNLTDGLEYAAKVPLDGNASHQFQHETEIYKRIRQRTNSANLVNIYPAIEHEGCPIVIMEYLQGRSLQNVIDADKPKSEARIHRIITNILRALSELHGAGIIHCDVKPSNIMLTKRGAVLFDFSASLIADEVDHNSQRRGSKNYMPPDELPSFAWDVYSVGVIYYQLFLGAPPNWVRNTKDKTSTGPTLTLPEHFGKYLGARPVIMQALSLDPAQRYPSADAMLKDLIKPLSSGRVIKGIHIFDRRYPALFVVAGTLLLSLVIFIYISSCQPEKGSPTQASAISAIYSLNPGFLLSELGQLPDTETVRSEINRANYAMKRLNSNEGLDLGISRIRLYADDRGEIDSYNIWIGFTKPFDGEIEKIKKQLEWSVDESAFVWQGDRYSRVPGATENTIVEVKLEAKQPWFNDYYYSPAMEFTRLQQPNEGLFIFQDDEQEFILRVDGKFYLPELPH